MKHRRIKKERTIKEIIIKDIQGDNTKLRRDAGVLGERGGDEGGERG